MRNLKIQMFLNRIKYNIIAKLVLINILFFILTMYILPNSIVNQLVGFSFLNENFKIWQPITSMFMHAGIIHLLLNMIALYSFKHVFKFYEDWKFLVLYFTSGIVGYIFQSLLSDPSIPMVGASGAVFGILGAVTILEPDSKIQIIFLPFINFKAKYIISFFLVLELVLGILVKDGIGHFCHFGGGIAGLLIAGFCMTNKIHQYLKKAFNI